jgi:hypothetical protein
MMSECQCYILGFCKYDGCGSELWDCDDVRYPEWIDGDPDCSHKIQEDKEMEIRKFYYLRDNYNRPTGTVCLIKSNGDIARGVAICSLKDNPDKKTGRHIAQGRAVRAMKRRESSFFDMQRIDALIAIGRTKCLPGEFDFTKSSFNPKLTDFETKLLRRTHGRSSKG